MLPRFPEVACVDGSKRRRSSALLPYENNKLFNSNFQTRYSDNRREESAPRSIQVSPNQISLTAGLNLRVSSDHYVLVGHSTARLIVSSFGSGSFFSIP